VPSCCAGGLELLRQGVDGELLQPADGGSQDRHDPINERPLLAMFRQIIANNRAGGWRKLKAGRST
jgi:hypothetical protein